MWSSCLSAATILCWPHDILQNAEEILFYFFLALQRPVAGRAGARSGIRVPLPLQQFVLLLVDPQAGMLQEM